MKLSLLLQLLFQGVLLYDASGWEVKMPKEIHGLQGSCLVIPCSFNYTSKPPKDPQRVVWYQWVTRGYPLVYDPLHTNKVIEKFRGKTDLYRNSSWDCSLLIKNLDPSHHREKLYTWIDPENVEWRTYAFYEVTSTVLVDESPQSPSINIYGGERMGDMITVTCSTSHSCPYSEPNIILKGLEGSDEIKHESFKDGQWKITLTRTGVVKAESSTIECSVTHYGGKNVTATEIKHAQCVHQKITIEPELADVTDGVTQNFTCTVYHSCRKENPVITWNYENMSVSSDSKALSDLGLVTYSDITFMGTTEDHGKKLICNARFSGINVTASVVLHVKLPHPSSNSTFYEAAFGLKTIGLTASLVFLLACIVVGVIIYKRRHGAKDTSQESGNKPFSKPRMPSPKSYPKSLSGNAYDADYGNVEELNLYGNI